MEIDWRKVALTLDASAKDLRKFEDPAYKAASLLLACLAGAIGAGVLAAYEVKPPEL